VVRIKLVAACVRARREHDQPAGHHGREGGRHACRVRGRPTVTRAGRADIHRARRLPGAVCVVAIKLLDEAEVLPSPRDSGRGCERPATTVDVARAATARAARAPAACAGRPATVEAARANATRASIAACDGATATATGSPGTNPKTFDFAQSARVVALLSDGVDVHVLRLLWSFLTSMSAVALLYRCRR
jgi:hypothetical protein